MILEKPLSIIDALALFEDFQTGIHVSATEAAALLASVQNSADPHETTLKAQLQDALNEYPTNLPPPALLRRYRYWDPIYVPNRVTPVMSGADTFRRIPLGIVCTGVAEIIDPTSVVDAELSGHTDHARLANPTNRKPTQHDRIDGMLFPGSPIGLFETTDQIFHDISHLQLALEHKTYALFSGSRSIQPCISSDRSDVIRSWLLKRKRQETSLFAGAGGKSPDALLRRLLGFLQDKDPAVGSEYISRLLFKQIFPTPWSTTILYFAKEFFDWLAESDKMLIAAIAWKRMCITCERTAIASTNHTGLEFIRARILTSVKDAAAGNAHCLVPVAQCPEVVENTGIVELHREYCSSKAKLYDEDTPIFVPGYLRKPGDWGLICQRWYEEKKGPGSDTLRLQLSEEIDQLSASSHEAFYIEHVEHVANAGLPENVRRAFERELSAKKQRSKFLVPSILVRRKT